MQSDPYLVDATVGIGRQKADSGIIKVFLNMCLHYCIALGINEIGLWCYRRSNYICYSYLTYQVFLIIGYHILCTSRNV